MLSLLLRVCVPRGADVDYRNVCEREKICIHIYICTYIVYVIERTAEGREDKERQRDRGGRARETERVKGF